MRVPYSYLGDQFVGSSCSSILEDVRKLVEHGMYTLGPEVERFEEEFAEFVGARFAVGVGTGTDALFLSLRAQDISSGDEVITVANTFVATVGAIVATGARPVFIDTAEDFNLDPDLLAEAITDRTKAIIPVHYAGCPADMTRVMDIARTHGIAVIEDACQAIGSRTGGKSAGTFGISGAFSLHPLKNLNVWGDGGVIVTDDETTRDRLLLLRNHGLVDRDTVGEYAYNSRLDSLQAIVGLHQLRDVAGINQKRRIHASCYDESFADIAAVRTPPVRTDSMHVYHLYMLQVSERDALLRHLLEAEIEAKVHYPTPLHLQPASRYLEYKEGDLPVCERQATEMLTLPVHQHLSSAQIDFVIEQVGKFYSERS